MHRHALVGLLLLGACDEPFLLENPEQYANAESIDDGHYEGELALRVRAFLGPVRIGQEECRAPLDLEIDASAAAVVSGIASCEFPSYGQGSVDLEGWLVELPRVEGVLEVDPVQGEWTGWFFESDHFYAAVDDSERYQGVTLKYEGWFEVYWTGDLEDAPPE